MKNVAQLILIFGIIILMMLVAGIRDTNPDSVDTSTITDGILRGRAAFAAVDQEIENHLKISELSERHLKKFRSPVLLKIRTAIHYHLRQQYGRIVNTVDFGIQTGISSSQSHSASIDQNNRTPKLHAAASKIISDFINQKDISVSVIIMSDGPIGFGEVNVLQGLRGKVRYNYESINGACVSVPIKNLSALVKCPFISEIWSDSKGSFKLAASVPQIGADKVHNPRPDGLGVTGEGVTVAVVDSGIDPFHLEFTGRIVDSRHITLNYDLGDLPPGLPENHGTHVAGIIGATANDGNKTTGVAPHVNFLDAQVPCVEDECIDTFFILDDLFSLSPNYGDTMDAIEWATQRNWILGHLNPDWNANEKADVINMSLGWNPWEYSRTGEDPMSQLIDKVVESGSVFVVSAGNEALTRATGTITSNSAFKHHEFIVTGNKGGEVEVTVVWDTETNDLDMAILDSENNNREIIESRTNQTVILGTTWGKTYLDKTKLGETFYEQVKFNAKPNVTYILQVEATSMQNPHDQNYEAWVTRRPVFTEFVEPNKTDTICVPGYSKKAITVGAVNSSNHIASFSSHGPDSISFMKPDIVAPGVNINSTVIGTSYDSKSGTSMAAPHVAGVAALILDAVGKDNRGEWNFSPDDVKLAIIRGAKGLNGRNYKNPDNMYGAGLVKADTIIFGGTVAPNNNLRFQVAPDLQDVKAAISWQNTTDNLDLVLSSADGTPLLDSKQTATNYETIEGVPSTSHSSPYYFDVINRSNDSVDFTGASTHPIIQLTEEIPYTTPIIQPTEEISYTTLTTQTHTVLTVAFNPNRGSNMLAFGSADNLVHLWNTDTAVQQRTLQGHTNYVLSVAFSPDGQILASGDANGTVHVWNAHTGNLNYTLRGHTKSVLAIAFSPDGQTLASGSLDETIRLWNPNTGQFKSVLTGNLAPVLSVAFSPDGQTFASGNSDGTIHLWNVSNRRIIHTFRGHKEFVLSVAFNRDGSALASGSADNTVKVWNTLTRNLEHTLTEHTDWVNSVAFNPNPDNWTLASGSSDGTVRLWDKNTGTQHALTAHKNSVESISFSPDGQTLASGSADGKVLLWNFIQSPAGQPTLVTVKTEVKEDVNGDGVVDILDLATVATLFGTKEDDVADVNGDGVVDIVDLVLVANAFGDVASAPAMQHLALEYLTPQLVSQWLQEAKALRKTTPEFQRGILVLERILTMFTPQQTALLPNYPNPFNPETWIPYQLATPANVSIAIYAADGKLVRMLNLGHQSVGIYKSRSRAAYWDGKNTLGEPVASGLYFYTLTAGKFTATRKMLIRK